MGVRSYTEEEVAAYMKQAADYTARKVHEQWERDQEVIDDLRSFIDSVLERLRELKP